MTDKKEALALKQQRKRLKVPVLKIAMGTKLDPQTVYRALNGQAGWKSIESIREFLSSVENQRRSKAAG